MTSADYRPLFDEVLQDIILVTHCHTCGIKYNVCFFGYVGEHCSKRCWKCNPEDDYYEAQDEDSIGHDPDTCKWCNYNGSICHANPRHFVSHYGYQSPTGAIWPMKHYSIPCDNECIKTRPTIRIPEYND